MRIAAFPKGELDAMVAKRTKTVFEWISEAKGAETKARRASQAVAKLTGGA